MKELEGITREVAEDTEFAQFREETNEQPHCCRHLPYEGEQRGGC